MFTMHSAVVYYVSLAYSTVASIVERTRSDTELPWGRCNDGHCKWRTMNSRRFTILHEIFHTVIYISKLALRRKCLAVLKPRTIIPQRILAWKWNIPRKEQQLVAPQHHGGVSSEKQIRAEKRQVTSWGQGMEHRSRAPNLQHGRGAPL